MHQVSLYNVPVTQTVTKIKAFKTLYDIKEVALWVRCTGVAYDDQNRPTLDFTTGNDLYKIVSWSITGAKKYFHLSHGETTVIVKPHDLVWKELCLVERGKP